MYKINIKNKGTSDINNFEWTIIYTHQHMHKKKKSVREKRRIQDKVNKTFDLRKLACLRLQVNKNKSLM